jgi:hypothetical protein
MLHHGCVALMGVPPSRRAGQPTVTSASVARNRPSLTRFTLVNQTKTYWPLAASGAYSVTVPDLPLEAPILEALSRLSRASPT